MSRRLCGLALTVVAPTCVAVACGGSSFSAGDAAAASDDASAVEGAADAAPPSDAHPGYCAASTHMFCEDFDEYSGVGALLGSPTWTSFQQAGGVFKLDTLNALSPPAALEASGSGASNLLLIKTFPALNTAPRTVRLEFDLRINAVSGLGSLSANGFAAVAFGTSITAGYAAIAIAGGANPTLAGIWSLSSDAGPSSSDAGSFATASTKVPFPQSGIWSGRFAIELDFPQDKPACVQIFQGSSALLSPCMQLPEALSQPHLLSIALGDEAGGLGASGTVDLEFDNVTFDVAQ